MTLKFMREVSISRPMTQSEIDMVAHSMMAIANIFELSYQEFAERFSEYMTEDEFTRVTEEMENG